MAKVTPILEKPIQRIGFMEGQFEVPHDIDTMFADDIADMFEGHHDGTGLFEKKS